MRRIHAYRLPAIAFLRFLEPAILKVKIEVHEILFSSRTIETRQLNSGLWRVEEKHPPRLQEPYNYQLPVHLSDII
jgi:hypothetical protein